MNVVEVNGQPIDALCISLHNYITCPVSCNVFFFFFLCFFISISEAVILQPDWRWACSLTMVQGVSVKPALTQPIGSDRHTVCIICATFPSGFHLTVPLEALTPRECQNTSICPGLRLLVCIHLFLFTVLATHSNKIQALYSQNERTVSIQIQPGTCFVH